MGFPYKDWFHISFDGNSGYNDGFWYEGWEDTIAGQAQPEKPRGRTAYLRLHPALGRRVRYRRAAP